MTLKELDKLSETIESLGDFMTATGDSDESGIVDEMSLLYNESICILAKETSKLYLKEMRHNTSLDISSVISDEELISDNHKVARHGGTKYPGHKNPPIPPAPPKLRKIKGDKIIPQSE